MTFAIYKDAQSTLQDGIETIVIPITEQHDLEHLTMNYKRGGRHGAVEWILAQLHRQTEIARVCGVDMSGNKLVLRLRQPGKQFEEWLKQAEGYHLLTIQCTDEMISTHTHIGTSIGVIVREVLDRKPFTQDNPPYWRKTNSEHDTNVGQG